MTNVALFLFVFSFIWFTIGCYYRSIVLPILHDRAKYKIFALRDQLRSLATNGEVDVTSFEFQHLEDNLNRMIRVCKWFSIANIIQCHFNGEDLKSVKSEILRFENEASDTLKEIDVKSNIAMFKILRANSPGWMLLARSIESIKPAKDRIMEYNRIFWSTDSQDTKALHC